MSMPPSSSSLSHRGVRSRSQSQADLNVQTTQQQHGRGVGSMGNIHEFHSSSNSPFMLNPNITRPRSIIRDVEIFHSASNSPFSPNPTNPIRDIEANLNQNPNPPTLPQTENAVPPPNLTIWGRVCQAFWDFFYSMLPRSEEFRAVSPPKFTHFDSNSTRENDVLWKFFKVVFLVGLYGTLMCVIAGILYGVYGEATSSSPSHHLHSFKLNSPAANNISLGLGGVVFSFVYLVCVSHFWDDFYFYQIREYYIFLLSLDLVVDLRIPKAILLTIYSFHKFEIEWGDWSIIVFVVLPFFFSLASISLLKLFQREFMNATGLLRDFIIIFVGPCYMHLYQAYKHHRDHSHLHDYSHDHSLLIGILYFIPKLFGYISNRCLGYICRPHQVRQSYGPGPDDTP